MGNYLRNSATTAVIALALFSVNANAKRACCYVTPGLSLPPGVYFGVFGGAGKAIDTNVFQYGTVVATPPAGVNATGTLSSNTLGLGGLNFGYLWKNPCWLFSPGLEFEGYYFHNTFSGNLSNPSTVVPNHFFHDSFTANTEVFLINSIVSFNIPCSPQFQPYVGVGIGQALSSINGKSIQLSPVDDPVNINHFNSRNHSTDSTFAGQIKAGLSYMFAPNWSLFAEYRYLYLGSNHYNFGSTYSPNIHSVTSAWGFNTDNSQYNIGTVGIRVSA